MTPLLSVIPITALINSYNFMDGLDGLVGGCFAVQLAFFALYLNQSGWSHRRVAGSYVALTAVIAALVATRG
ncbi:MAG: hypothetical protein WBM75_15155 [Polyangiales bacterium]